MKKLITIVALLSSTSVFAADYGTTKELYMKLDPEIGGYITLTLETCDIEAKSAEYSYKAIEEAGDGSKRRACWYRPDPIDDKHLPNVLIVEEMEYQGKMIFNVGSFAQYYFKPTKD